MVEGGGEDAERGGFGSVGSTSRLVRRMWSLLEIGRRSMRSKSSSLSSSLSSGLLSFGREMRGTRLERSAGG